MTAILLKRKDPLIKDGATVLDGSSAEGFYTSVNINAKPSLRSLRWHDELTKWATILHYTVQFHVPLTITSTGSRTQSSFTITRSFVWNTEGYLENTLSGAFTGTTTDQVKSDFDKLWASLNIMKERVREFSKDIESTTGSDQGARLNFRVTYDEPAPKFAANGLLYMHQTWEGSWGQNTVVHERPGRNPIRIWIGPKAPRIVEVITMMGLDDVPNTPEPTLGVESVDNSSIRQGRPLMTPDGRQAYFPLEVTYEYTLADNIGKIGTDVTRAASPTELFFGYSGKHLIKRLVGPSAFGMFTKTQLDRIIKAMGAP
jgi:hypothetical protein